MEEKLTNDSIICIKSTFCPGGLDVPVSSMLDNIGVSERDGG